MAVDVGTFYPMAVSCHKKGSMGAEYTVAGIINFLRQLCHRKVVLKHDGEPGTIELANQIQKQAGEKGVDVILKQTSAYSQQSNGSCEKMNDIIQNQVRAPKFDAEERHGVSITPQLSIWAWLVRHASWLVARYNVKGSGRTAFEDAFDT